MNSSKIIFNFILFLKWYIFLIFPLFLFLGDFFPFLLYDFFVIIFF